MSACRGTTDRTTGGHDAQLRTTRRAKRTWAHRGARSAARRISPKPCRFRCRSPDLMGTTTSGMYSILPKFRVVLAEPRPRVGHRLFSATVTVSMSPKLGLVLAELGHRVVYRLYSVPVPVPVPVPKSRVLLARSGHRLVHGLPSVQVSISPKAEGFHERVWGQVSRKPVSRSMGLGGPGAARAACSAIPHRRKHPRAHGFPPRSRDCSPRSVTTSQRRMKVWNRCAHPIGWTNPSGERDGGNGWCRIVFEARGWTRAVAVW